MARYLSVWSPNWPITSWRRRQTHRTNPAAPWPEPFALVETVKNARRLAAVSETAAEAGLFAFQTLADALALEPGLVTDEADPQADLDALGALADWCVRFSPAVALDPPDGLILDIEGAGGLWGGEQAMLDDLVRRLASAGIPARGAVADTPGGAWALSHFGPADIVASAEALPGLLHLRPIEALRLETPAAEALIILGVTTVGQLAAMPPGELARRFGPMVRLRLDQALGAAEEALRFRRPPTPFFERLAFFEPVSAPEDLARVSLDVVVAACARLAAAVSGARRFELNFHRVDGRVETLTVGTALPSRDAKRIAKLFAPKLETVDPGFGIEAVTLRAERVERLAERQIEITEGEAGDLGTGEDSPEALVDRLANRLGEARVWRPSAYESWLPERAVARIAPLAAPQTAWPPDRPRPVRLFRRPEPIEVIAEIPDNPPTTFRWRGLTHRVRRAEGPERLAQEWWRKPQDWSEGKGVEVEKVRDYYRVEDVEGRRFWIFRAGLYAGEPLPRWWLHGLFA